MIYRKRRITEIISDFSSELVKKALPRLRKGFFSNAWNGGRRNRTGRLIL